LWLRKDIGGLTEELLAFGGFVVACTPRALQWLASAGLCGIPQLNATEQPLLCPFAKFIPEVG